jgi:hypothetical protein
MTFNKINKYKMTSVESLPELIKEFNKLQDEIIKQKTFQTKSIEAKEMELSEIKNKFYKNNLEPLHANEKILRDKIYKLKRKEHYNKFIKEDKKKVEELHNKGHFSKRKHIFSKTNKLQDIFVKDKNDIIRYDCYDIRYKFTINGNKIGYMMSNLDIQFDYKKAYEISGDKNISNGEKYKQLEEMFKEYLNRAVI